MAWTLLLIAGLLEVVWAIGLKYTEGWSRLWPSVVTAVLMIAAMWVFPEAGVKKGDIKKS